MIEWFSASVVYAALKDTISAFRGRRRKLTDSERLSLRQKWRPQFEERVFENHRRGLRRDVVIRDLARLDDYPGSPQVSRGISPWFRAGLVDTTHRGILVWLRIETLVRHEDGEHWRFCQRWRIRLRCNVAGNNPYENIETVDWDGDEYYGFPHIYCSFANKEEPYEYLGFYTKTGPLPPNGLPIYEDIASYADVCRFSQQPKRRGFARFFR